MASISLAWVLVTMAKQNGEFEFSPAIFIFTGIIDAVAYMMVALLAFGKPLCK